MSGIFGILGIRDTDRVFINTLGQRVIFEAVNEFLRIHNDELARATALLREQVTSDFKWRYKLPGSGYLQRRGGLAQSQAVKATGHWDVAFPLEEFGAQIAQVPVEYAYATAQELDRHLRTVTQMNTQTVRREMMRAVFRNTQWDFIDPLQGSLAVQPLANGDSVLYPPIFGGTDEATQNHYIVSNYLASAIDNTNDPVRTGVLKLEERFGTETGGSNIACFIHRDQSPKVSALTDFVELPDRYVREGDQTALPADFPTNLPGRVIGRHRAGAWIIEWSQGIPSGYLYFQHLDVEPPVIQRADPDYTNLPQGLTLVAESDLYPFTQAHYTNRVGFGVGNRLNGVIIQCKASGSYDIPALYA